MGTIRLDFQGYLSEDKKEELYKIIDDFQFSYCFNDEIVFKTKIICRRSYKNSLYQDKFLVHLIFYTEYKTDEEDPYFSYEDDMYLISRGLGVCLSLANPAVGFEFRRVSVYLDGKKLSDDLFFQSEIIFHIMKIWELNNSIKLKTVYKWLKNNSPYFIYGRTAPIYLSAYTHAIEHDNDDALIYSTIGLENIFLRKLNKAGKKYTLNQRIKIIFPFLCDKDFKTSYEIRSDLIHGDMKLSNYNLGDWDDKVSEHSKEYLKLLIDCIRFFIYHNSNGILFRDDKYILKNETI